MEDEIDLNDAYVEKKEQLKARRGRGKKEKEDEEVITIKEFDITSMPPHSANDIGKGVKIVVLGKAGTGKSTLIQDICLSKAHLISCAQIFSGTEDSNQAYSSKFPPCCIYNKLDLQAMENFVTRQKIAKDWIPNNVWALQLVDDCADDTSVLKRPIFQSIFKNGRHWNMIFILSLQYCMDILPSIRSNIDYTFILRESIQKNRKSLCENYAGIIPSFQMFEEIMNTITEDFTALVINNKSTSNKLEDCVFWYKAKPDRLPEGFKFCHPVAWEFNNERLDTGAQLSYI